MHLSDYFARAVERSPDRLCVRGPEESWTFREADRYVEGIACALLARGVSSGHRVATYRTNSEYLYLLMLATFRLGCTWVPVNPLNGARENATIFNIVDVDVVLFASGYADHVRVARGERTRPTLWIDADELRQEIAACGVARLRVGEVSIDRSPTALVSIHCTGGTTGRPKAVPFTNRIWEAMIATFHASFPTSGRPIHLASAPLTHGAGAVAICLLAAGATQIVLPKFEPRSVLDAMERERVTHMFLPPTAIYMLLADPSIRSHDLSSVKFLMYAAAPMSEERLREALDVFGPVMAQTYGQTEAPLICTSLSPEEHVEALDRAPHRLRSCGRPTLMTEVAVLGPDGAAARTGSEGEIAVRGSLVMEGYLADEGKRPVPRAEDAWHRTGDVGRFDEDGFLYVVDRTKDMIISGGFNVYPSVIEQVLFAHPSIQDCAVIGVPDAKWGEAVKAVVELKSGCSATESELIALCRDELGPVRAPKSVEFWPELPRSAVGKVLKTAIRERFWKGVGRRI